MLVLVANPGTSLVLAPVLDREGVLVYDAR